MNMKKIIKYILIIIAIFIVIVVIAGMYKFNYLSSLLGYDADGNLKTQITIQNDVIYFKGATEEDNYKLLLSKVSKYPDINFKKIVVNSGGGDTSYGIKIANFIIDNQLDVEIEEICFSSCANYIFPAGVIKYIQKDAFVGWHGSNFQGLLLKNKNQTFEEYQKEEYKNALLMAGVTDESILEQGYKESIKGLLEEWQFFVKIKTSIALALLGLERKSSNNGPYFNNESYFGWTYSIEDMKKFGINNIIYLGEKNEYPNISDKYREKIFVEVYEHNKVKEIELAVSTKYIELHPSD